MARCRKLSLDGASPESSLPFQSSLDSRAGIEPAEVGVGRRQQPAVVAARARCCRVRAVRQAALEDRLAELADLLAQRASPAWPSLQLRQRLGEEIRAAEIARLERQRDRLRRPGSRSTARPDRSAGRCAGANAERADHRARGLAARHHQLAHAVPDQSLGDRGQRLFDQGAGAFDARARAALPSPRPASRSHRSAPARPHKRASAQVERLADHRLPGRELQRIDAEGGAPRLHPERDLAVGGHRAAARQHGASARHARQGRGRGRMRRAGRRGEDARRCRARRRSRPSPAAARRSPRRCSERSASDSASTMAMPTPSFRSAAIRSRIAAGAVRQRVVADEPDLAPRLRLQHAHQVGVGHRRERMVAACPTRTAARRRRTGSRGRWCGRPRETPGRRW